MKDKNKTKEHFSEMMEILQYNAESENFYQTVFEKAGIATIIFKKDNIILLVNSEFEKIAGYTRAEVEGKKKWMEFVYRKDDLVQMKEYNRQRHIDPLSAPRTYEFQLVNRDGEVKDIVTTVATIPGSKYTLMTLLDITEQKRMEKALKESERRLADTIDFLPDATFAIDLSGKVIAWNRAIENMTGVKAEDILGKGNYEYTNAFYGMRTPMLIDLVFGPKEEIEEKYDFVKREGNSFLAEADVPVRGAHCTLWGKAGPLYDSHGNIVGAIESIRDITDRKRMEAALKESERRLADIIDFLPDATFAIDLSGKVIAWNRAMEEMTGVKTEDMLGKDNHEYAIPFYGMRRPVLIDLVFRSDEETAKKYDFVKREGDVLLTETRMAVGAHPLVLWGKARPLYDGSGNIVGAIESVRDITALKQAQKALQAANEELEVRVGNRTADLVQANKSLQKEIFERERTEAVLQESEEKYNQFFRTSRDCVFITSRDGNLIDLNDAAVELLGYSSREELLRMKIQYVYANEEERAKHARVAAECGYVKEYPLDLRRKDGSIRHVLMTAVARYDANGKIIGYQGTIRDITERRKIEEERERLILELQEAISQVKTLSGLLPICASCKKIRDDKGYWNQIESYIRAHSEAKFSHSICPDCAKKMYPEFYDEKGKSSFSNAGG
ncbi:MAG: PAS domain S-box protein [Syntrophaceae bacterium]|nr:PAS domain S-box protein [Syntrophaceae bacterium]